MKTIKVDGLLERKLQGVADFLGVRFDEVARIALASKAQELVRYYKDDYEDDDD